VSQRILKRRGFAAGVPVILYGLLIIFFLWRRDSRQGDIYYIYPSPHNTCSMDDKKDHNAQGQQDYEKGKYNPPHSSPIADNLGGHSKSHSEDREEYRAGYENAKSQDPKK